MVVATGARTRLADIARLTTGSPKPVTPLTRELQQVVRIIAAIALGVGGLFFAISLLVGRPIQDGFVFAIGVTVALVPEALLPTVTLSLAWGAEQMARRQVLVREAGAVETLGSTTFICTDKTGTLTRNEMAVVEAWTPTGRYRRRRRLRARRRGRWSSEPAASGARSDLALAAARCSTGYVRRAGRGVASPRRPDGGRPRRLRPAARHRHRRRPGRPSAHAPFPLRSPRRRRMSVVIDDAAVVKGAPTASCPLCDDPRGRGAARRGD